MSVLERVLDEPIARDLGICPEDVTPGHVRALRADHKCQVDHTNEYGEHVADGLERLSDEEVQSALKKFEGLIEEIVIARKGQLNHQVAFLIR